MQVPETFPMPVPLLDLKPQYHALKEEIDAAMERVVSSQGFILGPEVEGLEQEIATYLGVPHAVGCASGTDAILLPLKALDPGAGGRGDPSGLHLLRHRGGGLECRVHPGLLRHRPGHLQRDPGDARGGWSERTRAVIPVHLFGQMAPWRRSTPGPGARRLVLEDCAQSIGASQRVGPMGIRSWPGAVGDAGAFSFFPTKNLGGSATAAS
jgi:dTDP-4-amino-4,6-dideoxygalactose transaminase